MALSREVTHRITSARNGNVASRPAPTARPRRPTSTPDQVFSIIRLTSMIRTMSSLNGVDRWDTSRGRGRSRVTDGTVWLLSQIRATRRLACVLACVGLQRRTSGFENNHGGLLPSLEDSISDREARLLDFPHATQLFAIYMALSLLRTIPKCHHVGEENDLALTAYIGL